MDFAKMIQELQDIGLSERTIAGQVGCSQASIRNLSGKLGRPPGEPRWHLGQRIIELYNKRIPEADRVT